MPRAAIVILADTASPGDLGRVVNALMSAREFADSGDDVVIVFDGAGTKWPGELSKGDHKYHDLYQSVRERISGVCQYCAQAFGVKQQVLDAGLPLADEFNGHPSLRKLVADGYTILTF